MSRHSDGMARYFFHTHDGDTTDFDDEGVELTDNESAKAAAKELLAALSRDKLPNGDHMSLAVIVRDGSGMEIYVATLKLDVD
ncbi:hypothetical protein QO058_14025 [Bosea vestrisii]|uniref:DUF6894 family protein n=1 Tax=Bosea vestrisii TaxID=151416 RepID=UPI0024DFC5D8|nr:hypothetical protein [Bosea vestrisii]WID99255.1 hypothetical protein QO058_14025 [Bosea vestrisii]